MNTVVHKTVLLLVLAIAFLIACGPSVGRATGMTEPQGSENTESLKVEDSTPITPSTPPSTENSSNSDKEITDGIWMLGTDISPGTYVTENHNNTCYWARLKGFSGGINDIIANGNPMGRTIVTITSGDAGFSSQKCGTWVLTEPYESPEPANLNPTPMINDSSVSNSTMKTQPTQTMVPTSTRVSVPTQTMIPTSTQVSVSTLTMVPTRTKVPVPTAIMIPTITRIPTVTATSTPIPAPVDKDLDDKPSTTIPDGTWKVNEDIAPGTYESTNVLGMCYWSRLSGFTGGINDIIANGISQGRAVVTILPTDHGFSSLACGKWSPVPNVVSIQEIIPEGAWIVGQDILEGTYRANSPNDCYWSRLNGFTGGMHDIIANGFGSGSIIVSLLETDIGFSSQGCGSWELIQATPTPTPTSTSTPTPNPEAWDNVEATIGTENIGRFDYQGDEDYWLLNVNSDLINKTISISVTADEDVADTYLELESPSFSIVAEDDDSGPGSNPFIEYARLNEQGQYKIKVMAFDNYVGGYKLQILTGAVMPTLYSELTYINVNPVRGEGSVLIGMQCQTTGAYDSARIVLIYEGPGPVTLVGHNVENQSCAQMTASQVGTYNWVLIKVIHRATGNTLTYMPNGEVRDHDGNVVGNHSFNPSQIVVTAPHTPTPTPTPTPTVDTQGPQILNFSPANGIYSYQHSSHGGFNISFTLSDNGLGFSPNIVDFGSHIAITINNCPIPWTSLNVTSFTPDQIGIAYGPPVSIFNIPTDGTGNENCANRMQGGFGVEAGRAFDVVIQATDLGGFTNSATYTLQPIYVGPTMTPTPSPIPGTSVKSGMTVYSVPETMNVLTIDKDSILYLDGYIGSRSSDSLYGALPANNFYDIGEELLGPHGMECSIGIPQIPKDMVNFFEGTFSFAADVTLTPQTNLICTYMFIDTN